MTVAPTQLQNWSNFLFGVFIVGPDGTGQVTFGRSPRIVRDAFQYDYPGVVAGRWHGVWYFKDRHPSPQQRLAAAAAGLVVADLPSV